MGGVYANSATIRPSSLAIPKSDRLAMEQLFYAEPTRFKPCGKGESMSSKRYDAAVSLRDRETPAACLLQDLDGNATGSMYSY